MKKPKKKGKLVKSRVAECATEYAYAQQMLSEFRSEHHDVIEAYLGLTVIEDRAKETLESVAKDEVPDSRGEHTMATVNGMSLVIEVVRGRRAVDAEKLLSMKPDLAGWPGLLTVKLAEFDKARSSGQITGVVEGEVLSYGPSGTRASWIPGRRR